ncbi:MAG TPA: hypothetical protein VK203_10830 [Nostocaceae cyanobacterium]|nr:hypothetical protein [Nostocaceae cyanobacterium]
MLKSEKDNSSFFACGVVIKQVYPGTREDWIAKIKYSDYSHADKVGIHGILATKYPQNLQSAVELILKDAKDVGIKLENICGRLFLEIEEIHLDNDVTWQYIRETAANLDLDLLPIKFANVSKLLTMFNQINLSLNNSLAIAQHIIEFQSNPQSKLPEHLTEFQSLIDSMDRDEQMNLLQRLVKTFS